MQLVLDAKALADRFGGPDRLAELLKQIDAWGGWDVLAQVRGLGDRLGGPQRLEQLLSLLR